MNRRYFFKTAAVVAGTSAMTPVLAQVQHDSDFTDPCSINIVSTSCNSRSDYVTFSELVLREDVPVMIDIFRRHHKAFANCYLIEIATQIGIRESRAIRGLYTLTADDVLASHPFSDSVVLGGHPINIHRTDSSQDVKFLSTPYHIPYRTLVPEGSKNVLVAGRTLSATREAFGSTRVQAQCMALGQAAGVAAALSIQKNVSPAKLDTALVVEQLARDRNVESIL